MLQVKKIIKKAANKEMICENTLKVDMEQMFW